MIVFIKKSKKEGKKYDAIIVNSYGGDYNIKVVPFGAAGYEDYTIHKDPYRMLRYTKRHEGNEDWNDITKSGFWAKHLLWNKPTLIKSAKDIEERYKMKVVLLV